MTTDKVDNIGSVGVQNKIVLEREMLHSRNESTFCNYVQRH
ncbi:MAG: hypothetical protein JWR26_3449 [Pedosphaera sp.]|nr:hypothetical protein [Pedosphaera sp.]